MTPLPKAHGAKSGKNQQTLVMINKLEILEWITGVQMQSDESPVVTDHYIIKGDGKR